MRRAVLVAAVAGTLLLVASPVRADRGDELVIGYTNRTSCLNPPCNDNGDGVATMLRGSARGPLFLIDNTFQGSTSSDAVGMAIQVGGHANAPRTTGLLVTAGGVGIQSLSRTSPAITALTSVGTAIEATGGSGSEAAIYARSGGSGGALRADSYAARAAVQAFGFNDAPGVDARSTSATPTISAENTGTGAGVSSVSPNLGVYGFAKAPRGTGVYGFAERGNGLAGRSGAPALGAGGIYAAGVFAEATADNGVALWARNLNPAGGVGILTEAYGADGLALHAKGMTKLQGTTAHNGVVQFQRSGVVVVPAGASSVVRTGIALNASSFVLATIQHNVPSLHVQGVTTDVAGNSFRIHLNRATPANVRVGWFVIN